MQTPHGDQYAGPKDAGLSAAGRWAASEREAALALAWQTSQ